ncbi:hypothetical protein SY2F82_57400 [Streptomyces sp. Y2F8-2]|nr:hypothetical protein SY2F82_57400 [Streptomyces sp. Y2F8-2]
MSSHCAPTVCIQLPMLETNWAIHSARKTRAANGAQGESDIEGPGVDGAALMLVLTGAECGRSRGSAGGVGADMPRQVGVAGRAALRTPAGSRRRRRPRGGE